MKTHAQIEALINELDREMEVDPSKVEHHWIAIVTLCLAKDEIHKPQVIKEMISKSKWITKEALLWVLSDI